MVCPLIRYQLARASALQTFTRQAHVDEDWLCLNRSADCSVATFAAFGGRDSGVPMLLGAAAFAALESDAYHHTLPSCERVEFASGSRNLPNEVPVKILRAQCALSPCPSFF